jgi:hypothetical protein
MSGQEISGRSRFAAAAVRLRVCFLGLIWSVLLAGGAQGQVDRAGLRGNVWDTSHRPIPGAYVVAEQTATGFQRDTTSSASGFYGIADLPIGVYTITFSRDGFEQVSFTEVVLAIGQTRTLSASLKVSGAQERVEVSTTGEQINENSDSLGARLERKQVQELPLNGGNWSTLTALAPGAIDAGGSNQRAIRFAGRGLDDNNFTADGIDATNIVNQAQQPFVRLAIPTDTIQEFRVESMLFTAESGSTPGGQVAVSTVSGTNQFHGDAFEFLRNDIFDARNIFDVPGQNFPFRLNQFGGSAGGHLVRDRTFFFLSYEGIRQTLGQPLNGTVPTQSFRTLAAATSPALLPILNAYPQGGAPLNTSVSCAPTAASGPTSPEVLACESKFVSQGVQRDHEDSALLRLDQRLTQKTVAYLRFSFDAAVERIPLAANGGQTLADQQDVSSRPVNGVIGVQHVLSSSLVNEAKFGFNRGNVYTTNLSLDNIAYSVAVPAFATLNNNQHKVGVGNSFSGIDDLAWVRGRHVLKFGGEVRRIQLNQGNTASGSISFPSLFALENNQVNSASFASELPINGLRKTQVYAFVQDEFRWKPNFNVNAGLRYSFYNRFHEVLNRAIPFDFATCGAQGFCGAGASFGKLNLHDIDPRLAFAWVPRVLGGKTVVRSGFGMYHGDGQLDDQNLPINNEVQRFSLSHVSFPVDPFLTTVQGIVSPRDMNRLRKDMYVSQWGLSVQQSLPADFVGTISYVGSKGTHLLTTSYINLKDPANGLRPYPNFGQVEYRGNDSNSSFNALQASMQRSYKRGFLFSFNYMYSHEIDDGSLGGGDADFVQNPACLRCDRASGDFDARHTASGNAVYELPFGAGRAHLSQPGYVRAILGAWDLSTIVSARTGLPVNVTIDRLASSVPGGDSKSPQRPNRVPGVSLTPPGGSSPSLWINPAAFDANVAPGTYGDAGRNMARGPGSWQADLGLSKRISLGEGLGLQFRAEVFNVFNHPIFARPLSDLSASSFGQIFATANTSPVGTGTPRQMQFMLRLNF